MPDLPDAVLADLEPLEKESKDRKRRTREQAFAGYKRYDSRAALLRQKLPAAVLAYLGLDLLKCILMEDPYFWGLPQLGTPSYLPLFVRSSAGLLSFYRMLLNLFGVYTALQFMFFTGPLLLSCLIGPRILGFRGSSWMYPDTFGCWSAVFDKGIAGWWGGWWHQTFRYAFSAPSEFAIARFGLNRRASSTKALALGCAFGLSGLLHAAGSSTQLADTYPWTGPFLFFAVQPLGILAQRFAATALRGTGVSQRLPKVVRQSVNFLVTHVWLYYTAPLLMDDFARGGVWMFEPVPVSLFRALGVGSLDESWWRLRGPLFTWYTGKHWWQSGIAM